MSLQKEERADALHRDGMLAAAAGEYFDAYAQLDSAKGVADVAQLTDDGVLKLDFVLQSAAIRRDTGLVCLWQAASEGKRGWLHAAGEELEEALEKTAPLYSGALMLPTVMPTSTKEARRAINAEHGQTLAVLGRMATLSEVMHGQNSRGSSAEAIRLRTLDQAWFGFAGDALRIGNNGLARVQNALAGARQERINGQPLHAAVWLGRALAATAWTIVRDEQHMLETFGELSTALPGLMSGKAARDAVLARP